MSILTNGATQEQIAARHAAEFPTGEPAQDCQPQASPTPASPPPVSVPPEVMDSLKRFPLRQTKPLPDQLILIAHHAERFRGGCRLVNQKSLYRFIAAEFTNFSEGLKLVDNLTHAHNLVSAQRSLLDNLLNSRGKLLAVDLLFNWLKSRPSLSLMKGHPPEYPQAVKDCVSEFWLKPIPENLAELLQADDRAGEYCSFKKLAISWLAENCILPAGDNELSPLAWRVAQKYLSYALEFFLLTQEGQSLRVLFGGAK